MTAAQPVRARFAVRLSLATLVASLICAFAGTGVASAGIPFDLWEYEDSMLTFQGEDYGEGVPGESWFGEGVGRVVDAGCDVTGDGADDVLIGVPEATVDGVEDAGRVYVIQGGSRAPGAYGLPAGSVDPPSAGALAIEGAAAGTGYDVACAGDVNGDGDGDLLIGEWGSTIVDSSEVYGISAYVVFGGEDLPDDELSLPALGEHGFRITDTTDSVWIGKEVAAIGDVDGDGKDDIALGDEYVEDSVTVVAGKADTDTIELVSDPGDAVLTEVVGTGDDGLLRVAGVGDLDGDDTPDLLVGAPDHDGPNGDSGAAFAISGAARGEVDVADWDAEGSGVLFPIWGPEGAGINIAVVGKVLAAAGDVNGDGTPDLALGSHGTEVDSSSLFYDSAWVVYGKDDPTPVDLGDLGSAGYILRGAPTPNISDSFGSAIAPLGDVDGDGNDDLAIGAPGFGDSEVETASLGKAYVVYGLSEPQPIEMATLTCAQGAALEGRQRLAGIGGSVAGSAGFGGAAVPELVLGTDHGGGTPANQIRVVPLSDIPGACASGPAEPVTFGSGWLDWGIKQSFRNYIEGSIATGSYEAFDGASRNPDGTVRFDVLGGAFDPADGSGELTIDGSVAFHGHHGQLEMKLSNIRLELAGEQGTLFADIVSRALADGSTRDYPGVALAALTLPPGGPTAIAGGVALGPIQSLLTEAGAPPFGGFYAAGTALDPIAAEALFGTPRGRPDRGVRPPVDGPKPGPAPKPATPKRPSFHAAKRAVTVRRDGRAAIATLRCGEQPCKLTAPKSVRLKIGRKAYRVAVRAPKRLKAGRVGKVGVRLPRAARKALAGRRAKLEVKLTIAAGGRKTTRTIAVTLEGRKKNDG